MGGGGSGPGGGGGGGRVGAMGQGGCEQRSEAFVKIKKKMGGRVGGGGRVGWVRMDVDGEVKFL